MSHMLFTMVIFVVSRCVYAINNVVAGVHPGLYSMAYREYHLFNSLHSLPPSLSPLSLPRRYGELIYSQTDNLRPDHKSPGPPSRRISPPILPRLRRHGAADPHTPIHRHRGNRLLPPQSCCVLKRLDESPFSRSRSLHRVVPLQSDVLCYVRPTLQQIKSRHYPRRACAARVL